MSEESLALLELIGLRPVLVEEFEQEVSLFPEVGVVLIRAGIHPDRMQSITDWVLATAADLLRSS